MSSLGNKQIMADNILYYMNLNNKTRNDLCHDLGFKYTTLTGWLTAEKYPRIDKIEMMANYFGITKADLVEERIPFAQSRKNLAGERIKLARQNKQMTLEDVAKMVGVTRQTIQKYESGIIPNIPSDKIELLASALETTPAYLMGWEDKQKEASPVIGEDLSPSDKKLMEILPKLNEDQKKIGVALLEALLKNK